MVLDQLSLRYPILFKYWVGSVLWNKLFSLYHILPVGHAMATQVVAV